MASGSKPALNSFRPAARPYLHPIFFSLHPPGLFLKENKEKRIEFRQGSPSKSRANLPRFPRISPLLIRTKLLAACPLRISRKTWPCLNSDILLWMPRRTSTNSNSSSININSHTKARTMWAACTRTTDREWGAKTALHPGSAHASPWPASGVGRDAPSAMGSDLHATPA